MAVRFYQLTLGATAKRLSDVYGGTPGVADPVTDIPYRAVGFQPEAADCFIGGSNVSTTVYGIKLNVAGQATTGGLTNGYEAGVFKLSDFWAVGAGSTVHIMAVPF